MTKELQISQEDLELVEFDAAKYLSSDAMIAEYLTAIAEEGDMALLLEALNTAARARGMSQLAKETGLNRESLYRTFAKGANPRFETVAKVLSALGVCMKFQVCSTQQT